MANVIITEPDHLIEIIKKTVKVALVEYETEKRANENMRLFTINQVALKLNKAHATITRMVRDGVLHATKDNLVPEIELQRYIAGK